MECGETGSYEAKQQAMSLHVQQGWFHNSILISLYHPLTWSYRTDNFNFKQYLGDDERKDKAPLKDARGGQDWNFTVVYRETSYPWRCPGENLEVGQQRKICELKLEGELHKTKLQKQMLQLKAP